MFASFRKYPATLGLGAAWVTVFVAMVAFQGGTPGLREVASLSNWIRPTTSFWFGDQTSQQIYAGQVWRALTATFVHYSLLHLTLNLIGLYQLGREVESWYGPAQFLGLYVVIGFFGNVLAALAKPPLAALLQGWVTIPALGSSGGGSGVLCGLIALMAVVGRREGSSDGRRLSHQMVRVLLLTALIGVALPRIDNFGHAGGAVLGALTGLADPYLYRKERGAGARLFGAFGLAAILAAAGAQAWSAHALYRVAARAGDESALQRDVARHAQALDLLAQLEAIYRELARRGPRAPPDYDYLTGRPRGASRREITAALGRNLAALDRLDPELKAGATARALATAVRLANHAARARPAPGEIVLFDASLARVAEHVRREVEAEMIALIRLRSAARGRR